MSPNKRILLFFILPALSPLLWPPKTLASGFVVIILDLILFISLGYFLWKGRSLALTLSIFLQGLNVIIRLMMFFPHAKSINGGVDGIYILMSILGMALSLYLLMRLDRVDVRSQMVT